MFSFARSNGTRPSICDVFLNVCFVSVVNTFKGNYNLLSVLGEKTIKLISLKFSSLSKILFSKLEIRKCIHYQKILLYEAFILDPNKGNRSLIIKDNLIIQYR